MKTYILVYDGNITAQTFWSIEKGKSKKSVIANFKKKNMQYNLIAIRELADQNNIYM